MLDVIQKEKVPLIALPSSQFPLSLPLPPATNPNGATYPPQTCSHTCARIHFTVVRYTCVAVLGGNQTLFCSIFITFEMLQHRNLIEGRAHMHYVDLSGVHASMLCISPALNRSNVLQHFERDNTIEISTWDCHGSPMQM